MKAEQSVHQASRGSPSLLCPTGHPRLRLPPGVVWGQEEASALAGAGVLRGAEQGKPGPCLNTSAALAKRVTSDGVLALSTTS